MDYEIAFSREDDGRWIATIEALPGVLAYGATKDEARCNVLVLALQVVAELIATDHRAPDVICFI
jgi:predicted RNase H-like HicB family nuclease